MQKTLIIAGIIIVIIGIFWPVLMKLPFGRLPGDIVINRPNVKIFFPIVTMVIISLVISILLWIIKK